MNNFLNNDITYLNLNNNINNVLKEHNINKIYDLWENSKKSLKNIGIKDSELKDIIIKLELNGFDLNKRYNK